MACIALLSACQTVPPKAYANRGDPESLLTASSDIVTIDLESKASLKKLSETLAQNPPTRITLNCSLEDALCNHAKGIVSATKIDSNVTGEGTNVTLTYDRVVARDCENRYIDNSMNGSNLNMPTFGCSLRANTVQMVTDKKQFTNPSLLDFQDGEKAAQRYDAYLKPAAPSDQGGGQGLSQGLVGGSQ